MKLLVETYSFKNDKGEEVKGKRYFVVIAGVNVYLKPTEKIGKHLLDNNCKVGD